jgi:excisionase family DNA binding protein
MEKLLTADELAEILNLRRDEVYRLTRNKIIRAYKAGKYYRYCLVDVLEDLSEKRKSA